MNERDSVGLTMANKYEVSKEVKKGKWVSQGGLEGRKGRRREKGMLRWGVVYDRISYQQRRTAGQQQWMNETGRR